MSAWVCPECTAAYSVGAPKCPQCGHTEHLEEGQDMPKITAHGGPSIEGGDPSSLTPEAAGTTSSTSSPKDGTSPETSGPAPEKPARTTGSRSKKAQTGSSSARGTAGAPTGPTSKTDADES